jgi:transcriptional antiterminator RfaH
LDRDAVDVEWWNKCQHRREQEMESLGGAMATQLEASIERYPVAAAWYVVQTGRYREQVAQAFLAQRDICSYLPRIVQWPPPPVGGEVAPMFPGYLFVQAVLADAAYRISTTPGVKSFVSFGDQPAALDPEIIDVLRGREGPDGLIRCGTSLPENCQVEIVGGPFRGLTAILQQELRAQERVRVLMCILQRETRVDLPGKWVKRV